MYYRDQENNQQEQPDFQCPWADSCPYLQANDDAELRQHNPYVRPRPRPHYPMEYHQMPYHPYHQPYFTPYHHPYYHPYYPQYYHHPYEHYYQPHPDYDHYYQPHPGYEHDHMPGRDDE